jgi:hypothetical protein
MSCRFAAVVRKIPVRSRGRNIQTLGVILHHPVGVEDRRDAADRFAHQLQPGERKFAVWLRVIKRNDLVFEQLIKAVGIDFALELNRPVLDLWRNRPTVVSVKSFKPPSVKHAEVNSTVRTAFHSAGPACFHRSQRSVQPKVDALH